MPKSRAPGYQRSSHSWTGANWRRLVMALAGLALAGGIASMATASPAQASVQHRSAACSDTRVPVALSPGAAVEYTIWGELCVPVGRPADTVQLLLHGETYSHVYWDFPYGSGQYSYVDRADAAGYATFNIDELGVGNSSHPASSEVTLEALAYTVHQVVQALRHGDVAGYRFRSVMLVGHSYGSEEALYEASTYDDVDALALEGFAHAQSASAAAAFVTLAEPAADDPRLAAEVPPGDPGYGTLQDAARPELFYYVPNADPAVIAEDEATKETATYAETLTQPDGLTQAVSARVHVPVLIIDGAEDRLICASDATNCSTPGTLAAAEMPYFPGTHVDTLVVPDAGHVINLQRNTQLTYSVILDWSHRHVPVTAGHF